MFTGIIEQQSKVLRHLAQRNGSRLVVRRPTQWKLHTGNSIAVDGVCLTVSAHNAKTIKFDCMPQTLTNTTLSFIQSGDTVNLERALRVGQELSGHFVSGHVDGIARVASIVHDAKRYEVSARLPAAFIKFCPERGSIALNGVSLTIAKRVGCIVTVALVDYTLTHTNLGALKKGDKVNIEVDIIARYLESLIR